jgi:hypothetical protein
MKKLMHWGVHRLKFIIHKENACEVICQGLKSSLPESEKFSFMIIRSIDGYCKKE